MRPLVFQHLAKEVFGGSHVAVARDQNIQDHRRHGPPLTKDSDVRRDRNEQIIHVLDVTDSTFGGKYKRAPRGGRRLWGQHWGQLQLLRGFNTCLINDLRGQCD